MHSRVVRGLSRKTCPCTTFSRLSLLFPMQISVEFVLLFCDLERRVVFYLCRLDIRRGLPSFFSAGLRGASCLLLLVLDQLHRVVRESKRPRESQPSTYFISTIEKRSTLAPRVSRNGILSLAVLLAASFATSSLAFAEDSGEDTSYISKPTGLIAASLEALLNQLRSTPADSKLKKKALLKLIATSAAKPSSAEVLWDLGLIDTLYAEIASLDFSSPDDAALLTNALHCLKQIVVQGTQSVSEQWNPRTLTTYQLSRWAPLFVSLIQKSTEKRAIHDVAIVMDQLVENAQDSLSPNPKESVDTVVATTQILSVLSELLKSDFISPPQSAASSDHHQQSSDVEIRVFALRSLANIASQSEESALLVSNSDIPSLLKSKWLAGCDQRSLVYISRVISILTDLPTNHKRVLVDSGWLKILGDWARSNNKQIRLATVKALENLMTEDEISRLIIREYGMDLFVELAEMVDIDVQRAAERVIRSFLVIDAERTRPKGPLDVGEHDPVALRKSRGDWKLDEDFNLV